VLIFHHKQCEYEYYDCLVQFIAHNYTWCCTTNNPLVTFASISSRVLNRSLIFDVRADVCRPLPDCRLVPDPVLNRYASDFRKRIILWEIRIITRTAHIVSVLKRCRVRQFVRPSVCPRVSPRGCSEAVQRRAMRIVDCILQAGRVNFRLTVRISTYLSILLWKFAADSV